MADERAGPIEVLRQPSSQRQQHRFSPSVRSDEPFYFYCKKSRFLIAQGRLLIGQLTRRPMEPGRQHVDGGLEMAPTPVESRCLTSCSELAESRLRIFVPRKGTQDARNQGFDRRQRRGRRPCVLLVEDVVTSGVSRLKTIRGARVAGLVVDRVGCAD